MRFLTQCKMGTKLNEKKNEQKSYMRMMTRVHDSSDFAYYCRNVYGKNISVQPIGRIRKVSDILRYGSGQSRKKKGGVPSYPSEMLIGDVAFNAERRRLLRGNYGYSAVSLLFQHSLFANRYPREDIGSGPGVQRQQVRRLRAIAARNPPHPSPSRLRKLVT